jgi:hypothetical protein
VNVTRVTVVRGSPFADDSGARTWLKSCHDPGVADEEVGEALRLLNRAIRAHRVAAGDPYAGDVGRAGARRIRIGYGSGDELVEGRSRSAYELPTATGRRSRRRMLAPEEQVAAILGGRRAVHPSEELLLRARLDLEQARSREAAIQAGAARAALAAELGDAATEEARSTVERHSEFLDAAGQAALVRALEPDETAQLEQTLAELERVARRRRHAAE